VPRLIHTHNLTRLRESMPATPPQQLQCSAPPVRYLSLVQVRAAGKAEAGAPAASRSRRARSCAAAPPQTRSAAAPAPAPAAARPPPRRWTRRWSPTCATGPGEPQARAVARLASAGVAAAPRPRTPLKGQQTKTTRHLFRATHEADYQPPSSTHPAFGLLSLSQPAEPNEQHTALSACCAAAYGRPPHSHSG
jgi:hypothetical protein